MLHTPNVIKHASTQIQYNILPSSDDDTLFEHVVRVHVFFAIFQFPKIHVLGRRGFSFVDA